MGSPVPSVGPMDRIAEMCIRDSCMTIRGYLEGIGDVVYSSVAGILALISRILFSCWFAASCGNMIIAYAEAASWGVMLMLYVGRVMRKRHVLAWQKR